MDVWMDHDAVPGRDVVTGDILVLKDRDGIDRFFEVHKTTGHSHQSGDYGFYIGGTISTGTRIYVRGGDYVKRITVPLSTEQRLQIAVGVLRGIRDDETVTQVLRQIES